MRPSKLATTAYVALVFLTGAVAGGFAYRLSMSPVLADPQPTRPEEFRRKYQEELKTRLSLDAKQMDELVVILDNTRSRMKEVKTRWERETKEKARPEMTAIHEEQVRSINAILSEPQRGEYEKFRIERQKRRQQLEKSSEAKPGMPPGDDD